MARSTRTSLIQQLLEEVRAQVNASTNNSSAGNLRQASTNPNQQTKTTQTFSNPAPAQTSGHHVHFPRLVPAPKENALVKLSILNGNSGPQPMSRRIRTNPERAILLNYVPGNLCRGK